MVKDDADLLIAFLLVVLIIVLLRKEIGNAIAIGLLCAFANWLWNQGWWGQGLIIAVVAFVILGIFYKMYDVVTTWLNKRKAVNITWNAKPKIFESNSVAMAAQTSKDQPQTSYADAWYYVLGSNQIGPVTEGQLLDLLKSRKIEPNTLIRWSGVPNWTAANSLWANRF